MASARLIGNLRLYGVTPQGTRLLTHQFQQPGTINAGGSPDGVLANTTTDKWQFIPTNDGIVLSGGWKVMLTIERTTVTGFTNGSDTSDCYVDVPITVKGGGIKHLGKTDLGMSDSVDIPSTIPANSEISLGAGYTVPNGQFVKIGGDKGAISIENTA